MEKKKYESAELEIIKYQSDDVLTISNGKGEDDELPFVPNPGSNPNYGISII